MSRATFILAGTACSYCLMTAVLGRPASVVWFGFSLLCNALGAWVDSIRTR